MSTQVLTTDTRAGTTRLHRAVSADEIRAYRDVVRAASGTVSVDQGTASPVHPFVLAWKAFDQAVTLVTSADADADDDGPKVVHLSQEIHQQRPLRADEQVTLDLEILGARRDPRGVRLALQSVLLGEDGTPFAELLTGLLLLGATSPAPFGNIPPAPAHATSTWDAVVTKRIPAELPRRYAEVSGDYNPIHLDDDEARAAGFSGVIAHGMSVIAVVCEEVIDRYGAGDASRVRGVGGRFSAPVIPEQPVAVHLQPDPSDDTVRFNCKTPQGVAVKHGWVRLADRSAGEGR